MREEQSMIIVLVPYPAHGHVTPMLRLAGALQARGFNPIVAVPDFIHRIYRDHRVTVEPIPSGFRDDDDPKDFFSIDASMEKIMPANLERILLDCGGGLACVVVDLLASWAIGVAARCGVPVAGFWPAMFATYRLISAIPELMLNGFISECGKPVHHDQHHEADYKDVMLEQDMLMISNQARLSTKELPWLVGEASAQESRFAFWLRVLNRSMSLPWILINSFPKEDQDDMILTNLNHHPQIIHLAPILLAMDTKRRNKRENDDESCIEWLKKQEPCTVIYVSFGTWVGPIGEEKITELAMALEETKRPFLWVLKEEQQWRAGLPEGYLERVAAGKGKVVAWAPQEEVLKSEAVGCYITHCGWNSTMEAIRHEKRLLCYPVSGDQFVNCSYIVGVWGIGIKLEGLERGVILDGVERIMVGREGEMVNKRMGEMKVRAMGDEGICGAAADLQSFVQAVITRSAI